MKKIYFNYIRISILLSFFQFGCSQSGDQNQQKGTPLRYSSLNDLEPNVEIAKTWWPDQRNVWTPVGWPDHYFRFNVLYNGTVLFEPFSGRREHARKWKGESFQVTFTPWPDTNTPELPKEKTPLWNIDGGHGLQGWRKDCETPVLWTDFPLSDGLVIREEVFGHLKGGCDVTNGLDPLYAWIRLSVVHVDPLRSPDKYPMIVQLSRNYHKVVGGIINILPDRAPYPKALSAKYFVSENNTGIHVLEPDGKVRFVLLPAESGKVSFNNRSKGVYGLKIDMSGKVGDKVDFLMPLFPESAENIETEQKLGFDGALEESNRYWQHWLTPVARFQVPENYITEAVHQSLKFASVIAEKNYETNQYSFLSGSWHYEALWSTPISMLNHMFLSLLGENKMVKKYSDIFLLSQGTIKPPGAAYNFHPGYFGTPAYLRSVDWLSDHGAILLQVSTHALISGDQKFIEEWTEPIVKGCEFIKDACGQTNHDGVIGLMPPAVATDDEIQTQTIWSLAWNYKGLTKAVQFLKRINHPCAAEFDLLAENYKAVFLKAFREASANAPRWKDDSGQEHPVTPTTLSKTPMPFHVSSDAFYLDTGPLVLVWAGLLDADDPLMQSTIKFFREGPNWKLRGPQVNFESRPVLEHEISTCEPPYSWNVVHSWQSGDRNKFLEGMYSLFVGALSQQTYISCEHRNYIQGNLFATPLAFWMARSAVIDDEIVNGELHLLRLCPQAWVSSEKETIFENMPTLYGPVNLRFKLSNDHKILDITFSGEWREKPEKIVLNVPPITGLTGIRINGKRYQMSDEILLRSL